MNKSNQQPKVSQWGKLIEDFIAGKGMTKQEFCRTLELSGKGEPVQKWLAGAKPGKNTIEKIKELYPALHESLIPILDQKSNYTSPDETQSIIESLLKSNPNSENVSVSIKNLFKIMYTDMKMIHDNMGERLNAMKPVLDTIG